MAERLATAVMRFRTRFFPIDLFGLIKTEDRLAAIVRIMTFSSSRVQPQGV
jgi:hypothetical protein